VLLVVVAALFGATVGASAMAAFVERGPTGPPGEVGRPGPAGPPGGTPAGDVAARLDELESSVEDLRLRVSQLQTRTLDLQTKVSYLEPDEP
jgi:hypothetical protein